MHPWEKSILEGIGVPLLAGDYSFLRKKKKKRIPALSSTVIRPDIIRPSVAHSQAETSQQESGVTRAECLDFLHGELVPSEPAGMKGSEV